MGSSDTTCWTMIRAAAAGDDEARASFAQRYEGVIRVSLAGRWRGSPLQGSVDDAVQDVFLACFKEHGALERADSGRGRRFGAFLYGVVRNVARRFEERRMRVERQAHGDWLQHVVSREDGYDELREKRPLIEALVHQMHRRPALGLARRKNRSMHPVAVVALAPVVRQ